MRELHGALPPEDARPAPGGDPPLIAELEACREGFRWARAEILDLTGSLGDAVYNRRPAEGSWSAAECVEHLSATAREMIPALRAGIRKARAKGWLAAGPFAYGRFERWFAAQSGGDSLPPKRRFKAPKLYAPEHRTYELKPSVEEFRRLQDRWIELLQLASGVDLARTRVPSPALSLLRLSLGQWLRAIESHQRRHLWQARRAVEKEPAD